MKNLIILLPLASLVSFPLKALEPSHYYSFFANSPMKGDFFFSKTKATFPSQIKNVNDKIPVSSGIFHTPGNSLELSYTNGATGKWQAIIYHHTIRGQDHFKKGEFLSFWINIKEGGISNENLPLVQLLGKDSSLSKAVTLSITKRDTWQRMLIPVAHFYPGDLPDAEKIIGVQFSQNGKEGGRYLMYVDDIEFTPSISNQPSVTVPQSLTAKGYAHHVDISWDGIADTGARYVKVYRSSGGQEFRPIGIQSTLVNRFTDFTGETGKTYRYKVCLLDQAYKEGKMSVAISAATRPMSDEALLTMVQEASFRYYWEAAETISGLAKENMIGRNDMIASGASGFGVMALIAGAERKFITRSQLVQRFKTIMQFLEKSDKFHGAFAHFMDGPTGKAEPFFGNRDNGGDLVETSFLIQGLLTARSYFAGSDPDEKLIRDQITQIWENVEWNWYRQFPDSKFLYWHWSPDQEWIINHKLIGWNEVMVTYLLAIASPTHPVPASMYYTGWANQDSTGQQYRSGWGGTTDGSMYANGKTYFGIKLDVGVSNGGPLFFTHYSYLGYDPHKITDRYTNYFNNNKNIALINHRYAMANPKKYKGYGDSCWGLTASDGPYHYSASEPVERQDEGRVAPTGAISSFPYTPSESMKALKNYYFNYGHFLWGEYGFKDAFNLTDNWCSEIYMGLNQAPMVVMIENFRTGLLWKLFMQNSDIQSGLKKLEVETASR